MISPVPKITLPDQIVSQVKKLIIEGALAPGQVLPTEEELCKLFHVGRSTIREAKRALSLMGLIQSHPGSGTIISENAKNIIALQGVLSLANLPILEAYQARRILEGELVALAAINATPEDIVRIQVAVENMRLTRESPEAFIENDLAFHMAVAECAHNEFLLHMYRAVREMLKDILIKVVKIPGVQSKSYDNHQQTFEAIRRHDPEAAKRLTLVFLKEIEQMIRNFSL